MCGGEGTGWNERLTQQDTSLLFHTHQQSPRAAIDYHLLGLSPTNYPFAAAFSRCPTTRTLSLCRSYSQGSGSIGHQHMAGDADGCYGMGGTNAADAVAVAAAIASASSQVMNVQQQGVDFRGLDMTQQQLLQHQRMSKADYVIVTEVGVCLGKRGVAEGEK